MVVIQLLNKESKIIKLDIKIYITSIGFRIKCPTSVVLNSKNERIPCLSDKYWDYYHLYEKLTGS
ncbi:MAG: hypothetical protein XD93_0151 [candidate division WS6 bacterium 34_10]|uniref:Uncharacterized protein n=1 Tax=candidate division WS6 bacterium 34_10 TaxID=1641389 RepID=A0A101HIY0_9BACT|nr:MAG: hypothetical protein XD93_0151 [candidate division WS6 bacterium 34_10]